MAILLAGAIISAYVMAGLIGIKTITEGPAFQGKSSRFDLRLNHGGHVRLISSKPVVMWEEPEAYFHVRNIPAYV
jgi:hypothetical protein